MSNRTPLNSTVVAIALQETSFLYNNETDTDDVEDDASDQCIEDKLGLIEADAGNGFLRFGARVDMTDCMNLEQDADFKVGKTEFRFFFEITCPGTDLSSFDGQTFQDDPDQEIDCTDGTILSNMAGDFSISGSSGGVEINVDARVATYSGESPSEGCSYTTADDVVTMGNGCKEVDLSDTTKLVVDGQELQSDGGDLTELTATGVKYADNETDVWRSAGTISGKVNNWTGSLTFADGSTGPTYSFSASGSVQDGTLTPPFSLTGFSVRSLKGNVRAESRRTLHAARSWR